MTMLHRELAAKRYAATMRRYARTRRMYAVQIVDRVERGAASIANVSPIWPE